MMLSTLDKADLCLKRCNVNFDPSCWVPGLSLIAIVCIGMLMWKRKPGRNRVLSGLRTGCIRIRSDMHNFVGILSLADLSH